MKTHDYEIIDFEELRLEQEDKFNLADSCIKRDMKKRKEIKWESDNKEVVSVSQTGLVSAIGKGTATVTATLGEKKEHCLFTVISKQFPFKDVKEGDWYYEAVDFMRSNQLMRGISSRVFAPADTVSRAQFVVIVHRLEECPKVSFSEIFSDVGSGEWYAPAVMWAHKAGIIDAHSADDHFDPVGGISREQMAVIMYRYAKHKGFDMSEHADLGPFEDLKEVSPDAKAAMEWVVGTGLMSGRQHGQILAPKETALRCECAMIIMRFVKKYQN